jgi:cytochrome c553
MMKKIKWLVASVMAVAFLGGAAFYIVSVEQRLAHSFRMVDVMADYQRYADKLHFAGAAENWELAGWYLWKLRKASWVVADGSVIEYRGVKDYDVAALTQSMLWPVLSSLDSAVEAQDPSAFRSAYESLVNTCNACHHATQHGFVKIVQPDTPTHANQQYGK